MKKLQHPYIWSESDSSARHQYRNFRCAFELDGQVENAELNLFADTRYRLYVNGKLIAHGPGRFKVGFPEYDTYDIAGALVSGKNVIAVTVCSYSWGTFLTDESIGGLVTWGEVKTNSGTISLSSSKGWKVSADTGYKSDTRVMSFALGMMEDQDTRKEPANWTGIKFDDREWVDAVPVANQKNWGELSPRSIPLIAEIADREPQSVTSFDSLALAGSCYSATFVMSKSENLSSALALNLCVKEETKVQLATVEAEHWLNGEKLEPDSSSGNDDRRTYTVVLNPGDNILVAEIYAWYGFFSWAVSWPAHAGILLGNLPGTSFHAAQIPFANYAPGTAIQTCFEELKTSPQRLEPVPLVSGLDSMPAQRGWRTVAWKGPDAGFPLSSGPLTALHQRVWVMDFAREVHGRVQVDFEAPAGAVLYFTASERLMPDGTVQSGFQTTRLLHRVVARGGRQQWLAMHPTGFRYLELMVQSDGGEVVVHDLRLARFQPFKETGRFLCSDAGLNQVWQLCRETQIASIEDAFIDCPWRERGLYTGDQIIQYYLNLALFGDHSMMRRCINLFYQGQDESGLLPPCTHYLPNWRHPDYAALSVESLWHYWSCSGDTAFVEEKAEALKNLLQGLEAIRSPEHRLVDATELIPYIDMSQIDCRGISFGMNAFVCGSFHLGSRLFEALGLEKEAAVWKKKHTEYLEVVRKAFWEPSERLFLDRRRCDEPTTKPSALGNALALYYGFVEGKDAESCLEFVSTCAQNNLVVENPKTSFDFHFSGYSSYYALAVLYRFGKTDIAERFMRREWRRMLDGGAWTCWEYFVPSLSLCHAWAASPGWYLSAYILGLRYAEPGRPDKLVFDPKPGTVEWAEGVFPHPRGAIRVRWENTDGGLRATINAPDGVKIETCALDVKINP